LLLPRGNAMRARAWREVRAVRDRFASVVVLLRRW
jgi:hypothetical protein